MPVTTGGELAVSSATIASELEGAQYTRVPRASAPSQAYLASRYPRCTEGRRDESENVIHGIYTRYIR